VIMAFAFRQIAVSLPESVSARKLTNKILVNVWTWAHVVAADAGCYANSIGERSEK
jgi:hypothetical protein